MAKKQNVNNTSVNTDNRKSVKFDGNERLNFKRILLFISFIEGASVMVVELLGAKIIAPYFGTSLYVWASVLGVTLVSLASGYYFGGQLSAKPRKDHILYWVLGIGGLFTILAPLAGPYFMKQFADFGVRTGSLLSVFCYLFVPLLCMGMVSPLITQLINANAQEAGKSAGTVFSVSTIGGILATFIAGFYLIPELGIRKTAFINGSILILMSLVGFVFLKKIRYALIVAVATLVCFLGVPRLKKVSGDVYIRYQSSGILGEWTVIDYTERQENGLEPTFRKLLLNGAIQTNTQLGFEPTSSWSYPHKIAALAGIKPAGSKALLIGMGGGSISYNLKRLGFETDIVELDERLKDIAQTYFRFNESDFKLNIDDGRHFINNSNKKYDVVIMDVLNGEVQPAHLLTVEGFTALKRILQYDGLFIINFQGTFTSDNPKLSLTPRSVYKTLLAAGFKADFCARNPEGESSNIGDLLIYGTPDKLDYKALLQQELRYNSIDTLERFGYGDYHAKFKISLDDAVVLVDDKPRLELMNAENILEWRKEMMAMADIYAFDLGLSLFE